QKEEENATQAACDHHHEEDFAPAEKELHEEKTEEEKPITTSATAPSIVVNEITNSQEIVQESPLKKLLSGSSFKKRGKKQKGRKSSDAKLSDSGDHVSDQLLSSAESADNKKEETPSEAASGEDGAWFSFKKLVTPQRRKKSSVDHEEGPIPGSKDGPKSAEAEQISDHSTEEGKRRKDSSVSWETVLCGSGRRRSRKTSDSEDDMPQNGEGSKQNGGSKEPPIGASNELQEILASSPKQTGSPPEDDESSTWRSFKKLVTPKKKVKEEEESTYEAGQDDSAFSIKKLLSGRKTRKSVDVSPEEVGKEVASIDGEDSETPAVVPLSEFDLPETEPVAEKIETIEIKEEVQLQDTAPAEPKDIPSHEGALEKEASSAATTDEEPDELTDSSNHQQLSDIPEEGIITETTPASVAEKEAAKDETIAEDLLEITSEAITAPEPADVTLADETEMVSAVSQLSDSSKTSGNTTPVPAEYTIVNTESLLQQVSETITASPNAIPVCLEKQSPEKAVCSVTRQILESSVLDQPKMLEIHRGSEATSIKTGLNAEGIDAVNEVAATIHAKSISHLSEDISTEMASEVPKEELDTAEPATDDVCEVNVSELQKDIKDLEKNISSTVTNAEELELLKSLSEESEEQADKERQKIIPTLESPDVTQVSDVKEATDVVQEATNELQEDILASEESRVEVLGKDATPTDAIPKAETVELDEETDTKPCDAKVEHEENVLENMEGLPALTAVHVSSVNEEARTGEVLERTTCPEETQPVCVDLVEVSEEPKSEVNLCEQQETVEGDKTDLLSAAEIKVADHTFISHEVMSNLQDVSTQNAVDTVIQVGITEDKEVIDVCHESIQKVDNLLATAGVEEETTVEEIQVTVQEVMQHVTSNLLETPSKMATQHVEQAMEESVSMIEVCETDQKESVETEDEKDHKEDLEEAKPDKPEVCTAARDARTEELAGKGPNETTMEPLTSTQRQLATPGNAGLAVPQNTGVISSVGNLESPSSLSLEFKLNIQFAQAKASTWPSAAPVERIEPVKQVDVSEAGVQAEESAESVRQRDEGKKQTELNEVAVQATSITEPEADSHLIQRAVIASQPVLQDDMQASTEKVDERVKLQSESEEKDEAEPELEFEMACSLEAEDTE
uniref:A kinase-anchoring proteins AKAP-5 and AKAP-12 calmodulin (CaM)-binding domain-containing protein n=1 Tax=Poecilia formosa TaxID=48698 RepID=A0A096M4C6_POEFO